MRKILALGLAAVMTAGALAVAPSAASAGTGMYLFGPGPMHPYPYSYGYPYYRHHHPRTGAFFSFGGPNFRFSFGVPLHRSYRFSSNPHVAWCASHYRTYNPSTNLFFARRGVAVACVSPYSY